MAEKRPLHKFTIHCFDCKRDFEYRKASKADAIKEFHAYGHSSRKPDPKPKIEQPAPNKNRGRGRDRRRS